MFYFSGGAKEIENISFFGPNGPGYNEFEALFESNTQFNVVNFKEDLLDSDGNVIVEIFMSKVEQYVERII